MAKTELRMGILSLIICAHVVPAQDVAALVRDGKDKAGRKEFKAALDTLNRALAEEANNVEARRWRGHCLTALGSYQRALDDLDVAIRLDDKSAWAFYARGMAKHHLDRHREAISDYDAALARDPSHHKAMEWRGFNKSKLGDYLGAFVDFSSAMKLDPDNPWVFQARARAAASLGALARARDDLETAVRLDAKDAEIHAQLGFIHVATGNDKAALERFDQAFALDPKQVDYVRLWRYWLQLRQRKLNADARAELPRRGWTGDLGKVLLGELTRAQLLMRLSAYNVTTADLSARRCEAAFYLGVRALIVGKMNRARESFRDALVMGDPSMPEWRAARRFARR
jgi:lipoprotein NlpI